jgi:hypothetical protein
MTTKNFLFENTPCTRCGGCGSYSWNAMTGSRCFKCNGAGVTLTKRGAAAQSYYRLLLSKRNIDLVPGDKIQDLGVPGIMAGGWREVISIELIDYTWHQNGEAITRPAVKIDAVDYGMANAEPEGMVRVACSREEKAQARDLALAFQARLTKQGKLPKREKV